MLSFLHSNQPISNPILPLDTSCPSFRENPSSTTTTLITYSTYFFYLALNEEKLHNALHDIVSFSLSSFPCLCCEHTSLPEILIQYISIEKEININLHLIFLFCSMPSKVNCFILLLLKNFLNLTQGPQNHNIR